MTVKEALKHIVLLNGKEELRSPRLINLLSDYNAFYEYPSMKYILKGMIGTGIMDALTKSSIEKNDVNNSIRDLYEKYGFRKDISVNIINAILFALNREDLYLIEEPIENSAPTLDSNGKKEHIIFSGVSLELSIENIAQHLTKRGFYVKEAKPYQIAMNGTFCSITDVELFINGSPFGLTKSIVLIFGTFIGNHFDHINMLYNLLCGKYGKPIEYRDDLHCIGKSLDYFVENIHLFSKAEKNNTEIFFSKWNVAGGHIEIDWRGNSLRLCYEDSYNTKYVEDHQNEFNMSSI